MSLAPHFISSGLLLSSSDWAALPIIIIIHLLGLAPAGYLAAPDNGPEGRYTGECIRVPKTGDGCLAVPLNAAESPGGENLRGGKRLRLRF
jgi:hypothetical protein